MEKPAKRKTKTGVQNAVYGVERERVCMRLQTALIADIRKRAQAENRSFTNMVETLLTRRHTKSAEAGASAGVFD